jgi:uncharacterized protein (TIGR00288 family)
MSNQPSPKTKIALLIDADNAPAAKIEAVIAELAQYGVANIRRAYGNWGSSNLKSWAECLHDHAIRPVQQFDYTKGKNATDVAMVIDAMDLMYTQNLDAFAIVSSDSDFTPLVMRILTNGLDVYGFGEEKTPKPFVSACSTFLFLEAIGVVTQTKEDIEIVGIRKTGKEMRQDPKLISFLREVVAKTTDEEDGWSSLAMVGTNIRNQTSFDSRNYGYAKLSGLFEAIDLFDTERREKQFYVRNRQNQRMTNNNN